METKKIILDGQEIEIITKVDEDLKESNEIVTENDDNLDDTMELTDITEQILSQTIELKFKENE